MSGWHPMDPARVAAAREQFPSCRWDVDDWLRVFDRDPAVFDRILDGIARTTGRLVASGRLVVGADGVLRPPGRAA